jgi:hypothetical protein
MQGPVVVPGAVGAAALSIKLTYRYRTVYGAHFDTTKIPSQTVAACARYCK